MKNLKKILITVTIMLASLITMSVTSNGAKVKVTGDVINVRQNASTTADVIATLSKGTLCEYLEEKGDWYKIEYKNYTGYVSKEYTKLEEEQTDTTKQENKKTDDNNEQDNKNTDTMQAIHKKFKVKSNIKILPLVHSNDIGQASKSDEVIVLTETTGWSYIQTDNISGWVRSENLEENKNANKTVNTSSTSNNKSNEKTGYINEENVNMRKSAGTTYAVVDVLKLNTQVTIIGKEDTWYKIKFGNTTGYVLKDYVSDTKKVTSRSSEEPRTEQEKEEKKEEKTDVTINKTSNSTDNKNTSSSNKTTNSKDTIKNTDVIAYAKKYLGHKYVWGGDGSKGTFDCSGFTMYVYKHFGVSLPHYTVSQYNSGKGTKITKQSDLKMGDIVFLTDYVSGAPCGHCGIYISDGKFIHADSTVMAVNISDLNGMYKGRFCGALRIIK